ncbi:hypothetical protein HNY73_018072 [Argiope bruennichi]|uniref:Uncharacterized protein n=1 Tax=Argiope bruennichi TaxID=94029 RepID=A0A8T0EBR3_ARGBR|nr:hypothetical protein HNY73_018072 [Argiope bruennichi]
MYSGEVNSHDPWRVSSGWGGECRGPPSEKKRDGDRCRRSDNNSRASCWKGDSREMMVFLRQRFDSDHQTAKEGDGGGGRQQSSCPLLFGPLVVGEGMVFVQYSVKKSEMCMRCVIFGKYI